MLGLSMEGCILMYDSSIWGIRLGLMRPSAILIGSFQLSSTSQPVCFHLSLLDIQVDFVSA